MAAKRFLDDQDDDDQDQTKPKKMRTTRSFASVIRDVVIKNFFDNMCSALEPVVRKVVSEEVENKLRTDRVDWFPKCPSSRGLAEIASNEEYQKSMTLTLGFTGSLPPQIFTGTKVVGIHNNPLQIILDGHDHLQHPSIRVELVVLDGDFPGTDKGTWTSDEFSRYIVRERTGKRPLINGESRVALGNGTGVVVDIEFTDNSSWIRSRRFRLGARVVKIQGSQSVGFGRIREAVTEPFVVKDHRGELYKKHHPPALQDEIWRLEKIGKGGAFHQKLASEGIDTVQDFLKLFNVDSSKLRMIMTAMSDRMWEATLKHAKTCVMGTKLYRFHGNDYILTINAICELVNIEIDGQVYLESHFKGMQGAYIQRLMKDAYTKWNCLEEVDSHAHNSTPLLTNRGEMDGDSYNSNEQQLSVLYYGGNAYLANGTCEVDSMPNTEDGECSEWSLNSGFYISHGDH